jgi:CheY-like chemotaxis protein
MPRVLVVDDSLSVRKMVERALEAKGLEVIAASSGAEAMERLDSAMPDLVVCDVVMPDVDGYRICEFVRGHPVLSRTPVLLISGIVNNAVLDRAARVQSSAVLGKPFTADDLTRKVDELLAAHSRAAGEPARPISRPRWGSSWPCPACLLRRWWIAKGSSSKRAASWGSAPRLRALWPHA